MRYAIVTKVAPVEVYQLVDKCFIPCQVQLERCILNSALVSTTKLVLPHLINLLLLVLKNDPAESIV